MDSLEAGDEQSVYDQRKKSFMELAGRFLESEDLEETVGLRDELARMTFGC